VIQGTKPEVKTYEYKYSEPVSIVDIINTNVVPEETPQPTPQ
jgi:hypothetical protein